MVSGKAERARKRREGQASTAAETDDSLVGADLYVFEDEQENFQTKSASKYLASLYTSPFVVSIGWVQPGSGGARRKSSQVCRKETPEQLGACRRFQRHKG